MKDFDNIHIHLDAEAHTAKTLRNFVNIIYSRNDLFYKALQIERSRVRYCKALDEKLVHKMNLKKPKTLEDVKDIWYEGYYGSTDAHYHSSRYHFLNLHSFFTKNHTVELRGYVQKIIMYSG